MTRIALVFVLALAALSVLPPAAYARREISDSALTQQVRSALSATIGVRAREIEVTALGGVVTLHGRAASVAAREGAALAARRTPGVKAVDNKLIVVRGS